LKGDFGGNINVSGTNGGLGNRTISTAGEQLLARWNFLIFIVPINFRFSSLIETRLLVLKSNWTQSEAHCKFAARVTVGWNYHTGVFSSYSLPVDPFSQLGELSLQELDIRAAVSPVVRFAAGGVFVGSVDFRLSPYLGVKADRVSFCDAPGAIGFQLYWGIGLDVFLNDVYIQILWFSVSLVDAQTLYEVDLVSPRDLECGWCSGCFDGANLTDPDSGPLELPEDESSLVITAVSAVVYEEATSTWCDGFSFGGCDLFVYFTVCETESFCLAPVSAPLVSISENTSPTWNWPITFWNVSEAHHFDYQLWDDDPLAPDDPWSDLQSFEFPTTLSKPVAHTGTAHGGGKIQFIVFKFRRSPLGTWSEQFSAEQGENQMFYVQVTTEAQPFAHRVTWRVWNASGIPHIYGSDEAFYNTVSDRIPLPAVPETYQIDVVAVRNVSIAWRLQNMPQKFFLTVNAHSTTQFYARAILIRDVNNDVNGALIGDFEATPPLGNKVK
jgi:hypothetical protein